MIAAMFRLELTLAFHRLWTMLMILLGAALAAPAAQAQSRIVIEPASVALAPGSSDRVVARIEGPLAGRTAVWTSDPPSIESSAQPVEQRRKTKRQWIITLTAGADFAEDATVIVKVRSGSRVSAVALPVTVKASASIEKLLSAGLSFEGETLLDGLDRPLLVRLTNLSDLPLDVTLTPQLPPFLAAQGDSWRTRSIAPRSSILIRIPLQTDGKGNHPVLSGKHEVAVLVAARQRGSAWTGQTVASTTLAVGVPGMEAVQGVLQIPSFLLFPGFLFVAAFLMASKAAKRRTAAAAEKEGLLSLGWSAGHWLVAISISMVLVALYPFVMRIWTGSARNILYGFDLGDVIRVWVLSLFSGALTAGIVEVIRRTRAAWIAKSAFSVDLAPLDLLDRLTRKNIPTNLPFVVDDDNGKLFCLLHVDGDDQAWGASAIEITVTDRDGFAMKDFAGKIAAANAEEIAAFLRQAVGAGSAMLEWSSAKGVRGVARVSAGDFSETEGPGSIITLKSAH